jgi:hypothetical protein
LSAASIGFGSPPVGGALAWFESGSGSQEENSKFAWSFWFKAGELAFLRGVQVLSPSRAVHGASSELLLPFCSVPLSGRVRREGDERNAAKVPATALSLAVIANVPSEEIA